MTLVSIANDLVIRGEALPDESQFVAFETSQPVTMFGADVAKVAGVIKNRDNLGGSLACAMRVQGSNDLYRWHTLWQDDLDTMGDVPGPFETPTVPVFFAYVRAAWIVYAIDGSLLSSNGWYLLTASLHTGLDLSLA